MALLLSRKLRTVDEVAGVQQIGGALIRLLPGASVAQNFRKPLAFDAGVGKIGREIIQRLFLTVAAGKNDAHAAHGVRTRILAAKYAAPLSSSATGLTLYGHARARQEHVEDRQGAADLALPADRFSSPW